MKFDVSAAPVPHISSPTPLYRYSAEEFLGFFPTEMFFVYIIIFFFFKYSFRSIYMVCEAKSA